MLDEYAKLTGDLRSKTFVLKCPAENSQSFAAGDEPRRRLQRAKVAVGDAVDQHGIAKWKAHTAFTHPMKSLPRALSSELGTECTQAFCKFSELLIRYPAIVEPVAECFTTLHLCEAPGMFIKALGCRLGANIDWRWWMNSLNPYHEWNEPTSMLTDDSIIRTNLDRMLFGEDDTGDIMRWSDEYTASLAEHHGPFALVTADGSFDCSRQPGQQERLVAPLIAKEVKIAMGCLAERGALVVKMFTLFLDETTRTLAKLMEHFSRVDVIKPQCSKPSNSEVYVVCMEFSREPSPLAGDYNERIRACAEFFAQHQARFIEFNLATFNRLPAPQRTAIGIAKYAAVEGLKVQITGALKHRNPLHRSARPAVTNNGHCFEWVESSRRDRGVIARRVTPSSIETTKRGVVNSLFLGSAMSIEEHAADICSNQPRQFDSCAEDMDGGGLCCWALSKRDWIQLLIGTCTAQQGMGSRLVLKLLPRTVILTRFSASVFYFLHHMHLSTRVCADEVIFDAQITEIASPVKEYLADLAARMSERREELLSFVPVELLLEGEFHAWVLEFNRARSMAQWPVPTSLQRGDGELGPSRLRLVREEDVPEERC